VLPGIGFDHGPFFFFRLFKKNISSPEHILPCESPTLMGTVVSCEPFRMRQAKPLTLGRLPLRFQRQQPREAPLTWNPPPAVLLLSSINISPKFLLLRFSNSSHPKPFNVKRVFVPPLPLGVALSDVFHLGQPLLVKERNLLPRLSVAMTLLILKLLLFGFPPLIDFPSPPWTFSSFLNLFPPNEWIV